MALSLSGCASTQSQREKPNAQSVSVQVPTPRLTVISGHRERIACMALRQLELFDRMCFQDENEQFDTCNTRITKMIARVFFAASRDYFDECIYMQKYSPATSEERREKCLYAIIGKITEGENFQKLPEQIQENIVYQVREMYQDISNH